MQVLIFSLFEVALMTENRSLLSQNRREFLLFDCGQHRRGSQPRAWAQQLVASHDSDLPRKTSSR